MRRKALRLISAIPGVYSCLALVFARRVTVRGGSMVPELLPGDGLLVDRLTYVRGGPRRGDIVLVSHPLRPDLRMVKRLTGLPGDTVGERLLARGEYWVEGDNAEASTDSREFGPVRRSDLLGRGWIRYWPVERWQVF